MSGLKAGQKLIPMTRSSAKWKVGMRIECNNVPHRIVGRSGQGLIAERIDPSKSYEEQFGYLEQVKH